MERFIVFEGELLHDVRRRAPGRGAWLMMERACIESALKRGFQRSFRRSLKGAPSVPDFAKAVCEALERRVHESIQTGVKARQLSVGALAVSEAMKQQRAALLLVSDDAGANTHKRYVQNAQRKGVPWIASGSGRWLGEILGRDFVAVVSVDQRDRADWIRRDFEQIRRLKQLF